MWKKTMKQALRLYGRMCLASVMGGFVYLSVGVIFSMGLGEGKTMSPTLTFFMNVVALVLQGVLFFLILYHKLWELGDKHANAADLGRVPGTPWRGLQIGLLASIPAFLSFLALIADKLFGLWNGMTMLYRISQLALYPLVVWTLGQTVTATTASVSWGGILCAGLPILFVPIVSALAYFLGYRHVAVAEKLVFVHNKEQ